MLEAGAVLSQRYKIEQALGQGGMGAVYLATMEALGNKKVAIKEMELSGLSPKELEQAVKQFKTEATFLAHLDHPNLVQVTDFFVEGDKHYLVMAYVTGQTLHQKLKRRGRAFPWEQVKEWADSLCEVLHYLHTQDPPILFRDLKPSNIMVEDSGRLKLIDFGIARYSQEGTKTSTFLQGTGTSGFSPIEQYGGGQSTDERSDVYALGATLYMMVTGKVPPDAVSRISLGHKVTPPTHFQPGLPPALDTVILKALAQKPPDRYATMAELRRDFNSIKEGQAASVDEPATEDLGTAHSMGPAFDNAPPVAAAAPVPPTELERADTTNRPSPNITIEMFPTQPQAAPSNVPWIAGASAFAVACVCLLVFAISGLPDFSEGEEPPKDDGTKVTSTQDAKRSAVPAVVDTSTPVTTKETKPATTIKSPRTAVNIPKPKVKTSLKPKTSSRPKPPPRRASKPKPKPKPTKPKYPTAPKPKYPTAVKKPAPPPTRTVVTAPPAQPRQPVSQPQPPQQPTRTANTRSGRPPGMPAHMPDPPPGMPWPVQNPDGSWSPPPPPGGFPRGGPGGPPGRSGPPKRKNQGDSMW